MHGRPVASTRHMQYNMEEVLTESVTAASKLFLDLLIFYGQNMVFEIVYTQISICIIYLCYKENWYSKIDSPLHILRILYASQNIL